MSIRKPMRQVVLVKIGWQGIDESDRVLAEEAVQRIEKDDDCRRIKSCSKQSRGFESSESGEGESGESRVEYNVRRKEVKTT